MMRRSLKTFAGCASAATAVEFGIVILPLILVMFGIIEFGRALWTREALQQTAIAGARCAGVVQTACGTTGTYNATMTTTYVKAQAASWGLTLTASNIPVLSNTTAPDCPTLSTGSFSEVKLSYTFKSVVPLLIPALTGGFPFTATACFPNNGP